MPKTLSCSCWLLTVRHKYQLLPSLFSVTHKFKRPTSHFIYNIINPMSYECKHMKSVERWKDKRVHWLKWMGISWAIKTGVVTLKCLKWYVNYEACMGQQMFWWCNPLQTTSRRGGISQWSDSSLSFSSAMMHQHCTVCFAGFTLLQYTDTAKYISLCIVWVLEAQCVQT